MLVFTRRVGERIFVAPNVWIVLVDVRGVSARIGIEAPQEVRVKREEHVTQRDLNPSCQQSAVSFQPDRRTAES